MKKPSTVDADELARCNARAQRELASKLADAGAAISRGGRDEARVKLQAIDARYAGLAAPAILDLEARIAVR